MMWIKSGSTIWKAPFLPSFHSFCHKPLPRESERGRVGSSGLVSCLFITETPKRSALVWFLVCEAGVKRHIEATRTAPPHRPFRLMDWAGWAMRHFLLSRFLLRPAITMPASVTVFWSTINVPRRVPSSLIIEKEGLGMPTSCWQAFQHTMCFSDFTPSRKKNSAVRMERRESSPFTFVGIYPHPSTLAMHPQTPPTEI